ncbi:uncharacterized protein M437DRAFT_87441 [Aureobasidium melanogenum CBS 110374]|uniref:MoaB/Mog domain-containing protein n=1 Tax=Aureobasidium melanogenum (strain CBS 110374) TaxID=1043003 RepID=A0A074VKA0_AURM1|nr:uncharacterized protein M437DRAFT_87441 [Aureobasidium melanogenum CBS 110374]KEQ59529.1 hypothetical protein M437DRAFT_87441 [Aureobasidium melanogenum CBS 110374]
MASSQPKLTAAILIISETASKDPSTDKCIPALSQVFSDLGSSNWTISTTTIIPDSIPAIQDAVLKACDQGINLIITSGGTGFAVKDVTPEAVGPLIEKQAPGLVHGMLASSLQVTPFAVMSRPVAGVRGSSLILTLPGSPKGAKENLEAVFKLLSHACLQASGGDSRQMHSGGVKKLEKEAGVGGGEKVGGHSHGHGHGHSHGHGHGCGRDHGHGGHHGPKAHTAPEDRPQQSNDPSQGPSRRYRHSPYPMLSVKDALQQIDLHTPSPTTITLPVNESLVGHVLAEDVTAPESVPAFRASIVDGYAVIAGPDAPSTKGTFPVAMISHAQAGEHQKLQPGQIARITTGAPLPPGATSVVMVEDTILVSKTDDGTEEKEVEILTSEIEVGENVREVGSDVQAGDVIMRKGEGISAIGGEFGLLASVGVKQVSVYKNPVVGVLSTGDEIVNHDREGELKRGEVRDTNRPTLLTAIRGSGFEAVDLGIVSDKPGALEQTLRDATRKADVIITSGGVSMGELDLLKPTLERQLGGSIHFGRVAMKPGKPTTFATIPVKSNDGSRIDKVVFSLPGNPASCVVTYHLFVLPALHKLAGVEPKGCARVKVQLDGDVKLDKQRDEFHRAVVKAGADGLLHAVSTGGQRSSRIGSFKGANALLCLPAGEGNIKKGEMVDALLMGKLIGDV